MITSEVKLVTPELAEQYLSNGLYEHQRPLRPRWVKFLASEMKKGVFRQGGVINFSVLNGREVLTDGQHRLKAIAVSEVSQEMVIVKEAVSTEDELAKGYSYIDIGMSRKWSDVIRAIGRENILLTSQEANAVKAGLGVVYRGFMRDGIRESNVMMFEKTLEWQPYARKYFDMMEGASLTITRSLRRKYMVAVALATIRFSHNKIGQEKSVTDFWRQVVWDDGLRVKDPRKKLREILIDSQIISTTRKDKNITSKQCMWYAIRAWNGYVNSEEITRLVLPQSGKLPIECTPFDFSMSIERYRECFENSFWGTGWKDFL